MKRLKWLTMLMGITLLVITGFQVYWLNNNYDREKRTMQIKANVAFQETVRHLQGAKLRFNFPFSDTARSGNMRVYMKDDMPGGPVNLRRSKRLPEQMITWANAVRDKLGDSMRKRPEGKGKIVISIDSSTLISRTDSVPKNFTKRVDVKNDHIFRVLYGIDSLQDSISVVDIKKKLLETAEGRKNESSL